MSTAPIAGRGRLRRSRAGERSLRDRVPPARLPELMDAPDCDAAELSDAFDVLAAAGRFMGGDRLVRRRVRRLLAARSPLAGASDRPLRLLDVGAGGGDTAVGIVRDLRRRGRPASCILADIHAKTVSIARRRVRSLAGDAEGAFAHLRLDGSDLPFRDRAFDLAWSTTTLHHLSDGAARRFVRELERVSRVGWVLTDLSRSPVALAAVRTLAATLWRSHPLPRVDGPVSVRRSFTPREIRRMLEEEGIDGGRVRRRMVRWEAWAAPRDTAPPTPSRRVAG